MRQRVKMGTPGQETVAHVVGKMGQTPVGGNRAKPWFSLTCMGRGERGWEREEAAPENLWRGGAEDRSGHPPERQLMGAWAAWAPPRQPKDRAELWVARPRRPAFLIYLEPQKLRMRLQGAG